MNDPYPRNEIDLMLQALDNKIENYHNETMVELKQHRVHHQEMLTEVRFTNGKLKKVIIALVAIGAFALGTGLENISTLLNFVI